MLYGVKFLPLTKNRWPDVTILQAVLCCKARFSLLKLAEDSPFNMYYQAGPQILSRGN